MTPVRGVGRIRIPHRGDDPMRLLNYVLKSVGFVAELIHFDTDGVEYDHEGTGFFVALPSSSHGLTHGYIITAKHVVVALANKRVGFIVNSRAGGVTAIDISQSKWFFHPSDDSVDVAVLELDPQPEADVIAFATTHFL